VRPGVQADLVEAPDVPSTSDTETGDAAKYAARAGDAAGDGDWDGAVSARFLPWSGGLPRWQNRQTGREPKTAQFEGEIGCFAPFSTPCPNGGGDGDDP
jgi:hypothetical protein